MISLGDPTKKSEQIWQQAVMASLHSGKTASESIDAADEVRQAFMCRFGIPDKEHLNLCQRLTIELKNRDPYQLEGTEVAVVADPQKPIGIIKKIEVGHCGTTSVLLEWQDTHDGESWVPVEHCHIVKPITQV